MKTAERLQAIEALNYCKGLPRAALRVGICLLTHMNNKNGACFPSEARMVKLTGLSKRAIKDGKNLLWEKGLIDWIVGPDRRARYTIDFAALDALRQAAFDRLKSDENGEASFPTDGEAGFPIEAASGPDSREVVDDKGEAGFPLMGKRTSPEPINNHFNLAPHIGSALARDAVAASALTSQPSTAIHHPSLFAQFEQEPEVIGALRAMSFDEQAKASKLFAMNGAEAVRKWIVSNVAMGPHASTQ